MKHGYLITTALVGGMAMATTAYAAGDAAKKNAANVSAQDQSMAPADAELTRKIRQEVMNSNVSTEAKNVTIVSDSGRVVLTGQVATAEEKASITRMARGIATNVEDRITVRQ